VESGFSHDFDRFDDDFIDDDVVNKIIIK